MKFIQKQLHLQPKKRGFHLVTSEIEKALPELREIFIQHTSASLTINENASATVRKDFETYFNKAVPENDPGFLHNDEGPDDMPAHLKAAILGCSVLIPVRNGRFGFGTWQGIYLCEHRDNGGSRNLIITIMGDE